MYTCVKSVLHVKYQILDQKTQLDVSLCMITSLVHEFTFTNYIPPENSVYICNGINGSLDRIGENYQRRGVFDGQGNKLCICVCE